MKLPEANVTPKLESLPKGLRSKADKIIAKKFGIEDELKPKPRQDGWDLRLDPAWIRSKEVERQRREANLRHISRDPLRLITHIDFWCSGCASEHSRAISDTMIYQERQLVVPCLCGTDNIVDLVRVAQNVY